MFSIDAECGFVKCGLGSVPGGGRYIFFGFPEYSYYKVGGAVETAPLR